MFADGVFAGEVARGEVLINDDDRRGVFVVSISQEAAAQQGDLHRSQILRLDYILQRVRQLCLMLRPRLAFEIEGFFGVALHGMGPPLERQAVDAGNGAQRLIQFAVGGTNGVRAALG